MHYERGFGREGPMRPLVRPWTYPTAFDAKCRGRLPTAVFNNEPIGPQSSVRTEENPGHIAAGYVLMSLVHWFSPGSPPARSESERKAMKGRLLT